MLIFSYIMPLYYTHELYALYHNMKQRCHNTNHPRYADWGGRGIKVCDKWREREMGFWNFVTDMGIRPKGYYLVRIDDDGDYEPDNCRWLSPSENAYNRRKKSTNKSGVTGVYFNARQKSWHATITINKKRKHLGWHKNFKDAVYARALAEARYT